MQPPWRRFVRALHLDIAPFFSLSSRTTSRFLKNGLIDHLATVFTFQRLNPFVQLPLNSSQSTNAGLFLSGIFPARASMALSA